MRKPTLVLIGALSGAADVRRFSIRAAGITAFLAASQAIAQAADTSHAADSAELPLAEAPPARPLVEGQPAPSTRYITFEKTAVEGRAVALGEWDVNGEHTTHGFGDREPTVRDFIGNVYAMLGIRDASSPLNELDLKRWLEGYERAWESRDPELAARLFTADATYRETPFAEPFVGRDAIREYWARVTADQSDVDFEFDIVSMNGGTGIAEWSARFQSVSGDVPVELSGIFLLELASPGEVASLREWWHAR